MTIKWLTVQIRIAKRIIKKGLCIHLRTIQKSLIILQIKIQQYLIKQMTSFQSSPYSSLPVSHQNKQTSNKGEAKSDFWKQQVVCIEKMKKGIKIRKKPESLLQKLRIQFPLAFSHVHNIFNIIAINEHALSNPNFQQSYFKSLFYINTIEKVQARKHALILQLRPFDTSPQPIQYLINRYKSFGDRTFFDLAKSLENIMPKLKPTEFTKERMKCFVGEPLSRFIDSMDDQIYICKVAPNKLVISRKLLQLLGEDAQRYSVELCKYKMPLRQIISTEYYMSIMNKSVQNIGLICDFINGIINEQQLHAKSSIQFNDYIYNRHQKKIYCKFILYMPTPQMSCIQLKEIVNESNEVKQQCDQSFKNKSVIEDQCEKIRYTETDILKRISKIPSGLLKRNQLKIAGFKMIDKQ